ncbi:uncharacterized protein [Arachis hypogaea]|uniref:uncharacterized protein n=1 Tax=Arachis hypogaea TaxID=3818 RepID=UPI003B21E58D
MTLENPTLETWKLHVDGSSNTTSGGAGVILESQNRYLTKVNKLNEEFDRVTIQHVPRERNARADLLSKLASTKPGQGNRSLIQEVVRTPSVSVLADTILPVSNQESWTFPILQYLLDGILPEDTKEANRIKREAANYTVVIGQLYKRGILQPLLKCIKPGDTEYILRKVHEGCCGHHIGGKTLAQKIIRAGYFWPTILKDSIQTVKNYDKCQKHSEYHKAAPYQLNIITADRPFGT